MAVAHMDHKDEFRAQSPINSQFTFTSFSAPRVQRSRGRPALRVQLSNAHSRKELESPCLSALSAAQLTPPLTPRSTKDTDSQPSPRRQALVEITPVEPLSAELPPSPSVPTAFYNYLRAFYPFHPESSYSDDTNQTSITIPINQGDIVLVHSVQPNGWADGTLLSSGARGWIPTNYCEPYDPEVMRDLCNALTYVWEFISERPDDDPSSFARQDYVRGVIAGVRVLLERAGCLSRDSPSVQGHTGLRRQRKGLLGDLSTFVKTAKRLTEQCQEAIETETLIRLLDDVLLRAFKVITRAARLLDIWTQEHAMMKRESAVVEFPEGKRTSGPLLTLSTLSTRTRTREDSEKKDDDENNNKVAAGDGVGGEMGSMAASGEKERQLANQTSCGSCDGEQQISPTKVQTPGFRTDSFSCSISNPTVATTSLAGGNATAATAAAAQVTQDAESHNDDDQQQHQHQHQQLQQNMHDHYHHHYYSHLPLSGTRIHHDPQSIPSRRSIISTTSPSPNAVTYTGPAAPSTFPPLSAASSKRRTSFLPAQKRLSATHRSSYSFKSSPHGRRHALASVRLCATHDAFLGYLGAFIGLHIQSRPPVDLLIMTQQSVTACQSLLACVVDIWKRDARGSTHVQEPRDLMHSRLAELIDATRDIVQSSEEVDEYAEDFHPEQGRRLVRAATLCVKAAGECVAKSRLIMDRIGDFDLDPCTPTAEQEFTPEARESRGPRSDATPPSQSQSSRLIEKPLPTPPVDEPTPAPLPLEPTHRPPPPRSATEQAPSSSHSDSSFSPSRLRPDEIPPRASSMPRSSFETVTPHIMASDSRGSLILQKAPALNIEIPRTSLFDMGQSSKDQLRDQISPAPRNSAGISMDSANTYISSVRHSNSNESLHSHTSTRATTPDHMDARYQSNTLQNSFTSLADSHSTNADDRDAMEAQLLAKTFAHELMFNREGQVIAGSLPALVERLTTHDSTPDASFVNAFLITFRLFTTPMEFAQALVDRFDYVGHDKQISTFVRLRVYNVFKGWLESYWQPETDSEALRTMLRFATRELKDSLPSASSRLIELSTKASDVQDNASLRQAFSCFGKSRSFSASTTSLDGGSIPPAIVNKSQLNTLRNKNGIQSCTVLDFDAIEIARQITIYLSRIYCSFRPVELLEMEWQKKTGSKAINIKAMIAMANDLTILVQDSILMVFDLKRRAQVLKQWVKIAKKCLELNNYDSLMAIIAGLSNSTIVRLKKTWDLVSQKTIGKLDYLNTVVDHGRNFAVLRNRVQGHVGPCLPFIGYYLTDLTFNDAGNQDKRQLRSDCAQDGVTVINFDKHTKTAKYISELQRFQIPYRLQAVPEMQDWIEYQTSRMRNNDEATVNGCHRRSLLLEPRDCSVQQMQPPQSKYSPPSTSAGSFLKPNGQPNLARENTKDKFEFWSAFHLTGSIGSREKSS